MEKNLGMERKRKERCNNYHQREGKKRSGHLERQIAQIMYIILKFNVPNYLEHKCLFIEFLDVGSQEYLGWGFKT